jgi:hypothetical protein
MGQRQRLQNCQYILLTNHPGVIDYGEPGVPIHRHGHVIDLAFSNIPFARTEVANELDTGSDHETLITTIPGRGS